MIGNCWSAWSSCAAAASSVSRSRRSAICSDSSMMSAIPARSRRLRLAMPRRPGARLPDHRYAVGGL